ncbi:early growth response protein 4 [Anguilla anguilla]|uniref:early growth response protein 4 n=1 Tax=Anguilla anguilla TaxID=7936 RepID=UPI0015AE5208|nr:early growth response protein 4 [Anguilla anguilla]
MMNGALYISFFQGQLESALEHVVQLAVQEITKTVGSSLNSMLQETTTKDQENQRLRLRLQSRQSDGVGNASVSSGSKMEGNAANDGTKNLIHTPSLSSEHAVHTNTHWLEEKGRALGQLKLVMEQVLKFALAELTKIVEDSFDDLLQELLKKEKENQSLSVRVQSEEEERGKEENHTGSPSRGSRERPERPAGSPLCGAEALLGKKAAETPNAAEKQTVLSVTQDWVPILDKVFGQKWCRDLWQVKEMGMAGGDLTSIMAAGAFPECIIQDEEELPLAPSGLAEENGGTPRTPQTGGRPAAASSAAGSPGCSSPAAAEGHHHGDDLQLRSPSMLHRLLTLPAQGLGQMMCGDSGMDVLPSPAAASPALPEPPTEPRSPLTDPSGPGPGGEAAGEEAVREEEPEEEEEDEEGAAAAAALSPAAGAERSSSPPPGRKTHPCRRCGKRFGRLPLLKAHQQTHAEPTPSRCSLCGKRFAQASRLQAHLRTHAGKHT